MVDAGKVTVKVELDASDVPSDLSRAVSTQLKPALSKAEREVEKSAAQIKKSVSAIGPSLGGVGTSVSKSVRPAMRDVEREVERSMTGVRNKIAGIGGALSGMAGKFGGPASGIAAAAGNVTKGLAGVSTAGSAAAAGVMAVGAAAAASVAAVAAIGAAAAVVGKQFYDLGSEADDLNDKLLIKTGGSVAELAALKDSIQKMGTTNVPLGFSAIADVAVDVTRNLKLTGPALEELSSRIANLQRTTGESINVRSLSRVFKTLGVDAAGQIPALNELAQYSRQTGLSVNTMVESLATGGLTLKNAGLSFSESAGLLGQLSEAGVEASQVMPGITKLLREAPKMGKTGSQALSDVVNQIRSLSDAGREIEAKGIADKVFGRNSVPFFEAIKQGKIDLDNLRLDGPVQDINELAGKTDDWSERWVVLQNSIKKALEPFGTAIFDGVNAQLGKLADWVTANQDVIVVFFVDLGKVFIDLGSAALRGIGEVVRAVGYLMAPIGDLLGGLATLDAAIADALGKDDEAAASRKQAEGFFAWGETLTKVGNAAIEASKGSDAAKDSLDAIGESVRNATGETEAFGAQLGALPVDGVEVPISVSGIPEADAAMDDLFSKYRTLSVGVELGDAAAAGALGGTLLGANLGGSGPIVGTGVPYGLPAGTSTGGYGGPGQDKFPQWVRDLGAQFGVQPSTYSGHQEGGGLNQGIDWVGTTEAMDRFAKALAASKPGGLEQVIWQNPDTGEMTGLTPDGRVVKQGGEYYRDDWAGHQDHVHTAFTSSVAMGVPRGGSPNDPQAYMPNLPAAAVPPGMPPPVDPGAAPVPVTVAPVEVPIIPLYSETTDDPELNALLAKQDAAANAKRQREANAAATAAAQAIADAEAAVKAAEAERTAVNEDVTATIDAKAKAEADYQKSLKALTDAQTAQAELLTDQQDQITKDQITQRQQANAAAKQQAEPFDYSKLPLGDPRRIIAGAITGAGGSMEDVNALLGNTVAAAAQGAAQPLGQAAGDAAATAFNTSVIPVSTPTAPDTDTNTLLAERNPAVLAKLAGLNVPDYTRQGGDPGEVMANGGPGFGANGALMGDTAAMIDRTLTSMEAANQARQDQLLAILGQIAAKVGAEVLSPIVESATTGALTGIAAEIGTAMGETAGPIIGEKTAQAVDEKVAEQQSSGTQAIPGMAGGGGIFGGTPGKDSVPAMLMPGEWVLTTADVARLGGFAGVERLIAGLQGSGGIRHYATGGGVGRASTGNPNGGQNVNSTVGADFFGLSQIPVLALAINALTQVLLKLIGVEIMQRDALIEVADEFRDFRGEFKAFDAAGRIKSDNSGLTDRTSSSQKQAADERIRILKMVIDGIVKYAIEKIIVPLGKAIGNAIVSALAGAAGGAISGIGGGGGGIAGGIVSAAVSAAGAVFIDIAAEVFTIAAETLISVGLDVLGEFLQTIFPNLTTALFGGALMEQIAGPVSQVMIGAIGIVTSGFGNLMASLGGLFADFLPSLQTFAAGFVPLTASLSGIVGVLSSIAAILGQIFGALTAALSPVVSAVASLLAGLSPLLSALTLNANLLSSLTTVVNSLIQGIQSLIPRLPGLTLPTAPALPASVTALVPIQPIADAVAQGVRPLTGAVSGMTSSVASFIKPIEGLSATIVGTNSLASAVADVGLAVGTFSTAVAKPIDVLFTAISGSNRLAAPTATTTSTTINAPIMVTAATPLSTATTIANRLLSLVG